MKIVLMALVALLLLPCAAQQSEECPPGPEYSLLATEVPTSNSDDPKEFGPVVSPDGRKSLTVKHILYKDDDGLLLKFLVDGREVARKEDSANGAEILWSPDSNYVAVTTTWCCSGFGGGYLLLYRVDGRRLRRYEVSGTIIDAFQTVVKCELKTDSLLRTAAVVWLAPDRLLVIAHVVRVSVCDSTGLFEAYEVTVPDFRIVTRYNQVEAKEKFWTSMGCGLRIANDECVRNPKSCWQTDLHPETK
ncbi:MAG: hypothetical protein ACREVG_11735 [Burkholderiales bacterium]